jgi:uncharacterized membrane protein
LESKTSLAKAFLLVALLFAGTSLNISSASALPVKFVQSTYITVSSDGDASVNQTLAMPQNSTSVTIPLLSSQVGDILAINQAGAPESYQIEGGNITIYTLGDSMVSLTYYTSALTTKLGPVWTLSFSWDSNSTVELPYGSTILSLSDVPLSVSEQGGIPVIVLGPGSWQVSYGLPIAVSTSQSSTSSESAATTSTSSSTLVGSTQSTAASSSGSSSPADVLVPATAVILAATAFLLWRRKGSGPSGAGVLRPDDLEMLRFIRDRGGKVVEAEIRERFDVPRTTAWRQTKRLEQLGYIRIKKLGSQNQLELARSDFE